MFHHRITVVVCRPLLLLLPLFLVSCLAPETTRPPEPQSASASETSSDPGPAPISTAAQCAVCGMAPANNVQWQSQVQFTDGQHTDFCSPRDLLIFLNRMETFDSQHTAADIEAIWVKDYATNGWIDARKAHFVAGSSVKGPMGEEFIPFEIVNTARQLIASKSGQFFALRQINMDVIASFIPANQLPTGLMEGQQ